MQPTGDDVAAFLGRAGDTTVFDLAEAHLPIVTAFVKAYTRDGGFTGPIPGDDIAAVIVAATARLTMNPEQVQRYAAADYSETPGSLNGWTLPELAVLHRYRRRAQ